MRNIVIKSFYPKPFPDVPFILNRAAIERLYHLPVQLLTAAGLPANYFPVSIAVPFPLQNPIIKIICHPE